jgi:uncharacterized protein YajQ (UPF0234 family)
MSKKPISGYNPEQSSEVLDYIVQTVFPALDILNSKIDSKMSHEEASQALTILSEKNEKLKQMVKLLASKLDADTVAGLDKDFLESINNLE